MAFRYSIEVRHSGLGKYRCISGTDEGVVRAKARAQILDWERQYKTKAERERKIADRESKQQEAKNRTEDAQWAIAAMTGLLKATLDVHDAIDWDKLKNHQPFSVPQPTVPSYEEYPREPLPDAPQFQPVLSMFDKLLGSRVERKKVEAAALFERAHAEWTSAIATIQAVNDKLHAEYAAALEKWNQDKENYETQLRVENDAVETRKAAYLSGDPEAIADYCEMVLSYSSYPLDFSPEFELEINPDTKILVVDYGLPHPGQLPNIKEVKYIKSRDEFIESRLSESERNKMYDDVIYQICLRSIHELFEADVVNAIEAVVFNGWVRSIDRATGKQAEGCLVSIQVGKAAFLDIDLGNVDAKTCFKSLKGVGSSKLHGLTPVPPVLSISREDKRFVSSHEVASQLDDRFNLAAMDWEDFEHLIRELFEKEFKHSGGEVRITQASRDGGVDAVAFDPDPIRGGKIVIQAKRYTNTVGVSFVRDLYGTVLNEGATKGILVTTSDYGPDAYDFAKGKSLTLLNGGNLLHLLEKHGHKAKIDIKEAKLLLAKDGQA